MSGATPASRLRKRMLGTGVLNFDASEMAVLLEGAGGSLADATEKGDVEGEARARGELEAYTQLLIRTRVLPFITPGARGAWTIAQVKKELEDKSVAAATCDCWGKTWCS